MTRPRHCLRISVVAALLAMVPSTASSSEITAAPLNEAIAETDITTGWGIPSTVVMIGNSKSRMEIDTGSSSLCVANEFFPRLERKSAKAVRIVTATGAYSSEVYEVPPLSIGTFVVRDLFTDVDNGRCNFGSSWSRAGERIDGLIGGSVFAQKVLQLDFPAGKMRVYEQYTRDEEESEADIYFERGLPMVRAKFGNRQISAVIDTGNAYGMSVGPNEKDYELQSPRPIALVYGSSEKMSLPSALTAASELTVAGQRVSNPFGPRINFTTIGMLTLYRSRVTIDYAKRKLYLKPRTDPPPPDQPDASGLRFRRGAEGTFVRDLYVKLPAYMAGMRTDDRIVSFNGQDVDKYSLGEMYELLSHSGKEVTFVVEPAAAQAVDGKVSTAAVKQKSFTFKLRHPFTWPPVWPEKPVTKKPIPLD